jgi:polysaccharide biosynthesis protein PelF
MKTGDLRGTGHRGIADVCLVVEGAYPYVSGGVSTWLDWLMRQQPETVFSVVALVADEKPLTPKYELPANLATLRTVPLSRIGKQPGASDLAIDPRPLASLLCGVLRDGEPQAFAGLVRLLAQPVARTSLGRLRPPTPPTAAELLRSRRVWLAMVDCYRRLTPHASFQDFFWAWRSLAGGLFAVLTEPIPPARIYHAISSGYAGLFTARASVLTGSPAAITEHGIYTNERRIDLIMADWVVDTIRMRPGVVDPRKDVLDFWIEAFEAFARIAYSTSARITTLYSANQSFQTALGASDEKLEVIPNGIRLEKFASLPPRGAGGPPTVGLLGRVVPIKDIASYIAAAAVVRREIPNVQMLVMGPTDEDPGYFAECQRLVAELSLGETVRFTGKVDIFQALPTIDVLCLTSISEAQPLSLLEAGAARVACVATDVGSCREIIEGAPDEDPRLGAGGRVVPPMDPAAIGAALVELLRDDQLRRRCGETLRRRVELSFTSDAASARYASLYSELAAA